MRFFSKRYDEITSDDIQSLLDNRVVESQTMEFKAELPDPRDEAAKGKVVRSIVAMANADGGVVIFGVDESDAANIKHGFACRLRDIGESVDDAGRRIAQMLATKVDPPLTTQIRTHLVVMPDSTRILVLGVARSLAGPHTELYREQIPRRAERLVYVPRASELRRMFLETESMFEECERFVDARFKRLATVPFEKPAVIIVHVLPIGRLRESIDVRAFHNASRGSFSPLGGGGFNSRFNSEGFVYESSPNGAAHLVRGRTQLFRFGGIEGAHCGYVIDRAYPGVEAYQALYAPATSQHIRQFITQSIENLTKHAAGVFPFFASLSMEHVRGVRMYGVDQYEHGPPIDVDRVQANAVVESEADVAAASYSVTRVMWQAGGFADDFSVKAT